MKKGLNIFLVVIAMLVSFSARSQAFVDSCFTSQNTGTSFPNSADLCNFDADLLQWTGASWIGAWPGANVTVPPPLTNSGCRAIWIGNGVTWTTGGEGFGLRLITPLVAGQTYTFNFTYISTGTGSTGNFAPFLYTNNTTAIAGATLVGTLPSVSFSWTTNTFSFVAAAAQNGHNWILIHNGSAGTSGMFTSFCSICTSQPPPNTCSVAIGNDTTLCTGDQLFLNATTAGATYLWQDGSTNPTYTVTNPGMYWVEVNTGSCLAYDTINVSYAAPPLVVMSPNDSICQAQFTTVSAAGGNSYLWNTGATSSSITISPSVTTTYTVAVTGNNCSTLDSVTVFVFPPITSTLAQTNITCNGANDGSASVAPAGGSPPYTYAWAPSGGTNNSAANLGPGTYTVTIGDGAGCQQQQTVTITEPPALTLGITGSTAACTGTPANFTAVPAGGTGIYSYAWSGGLPATANQSVLIASAVTYTCTVTDANGCIVTQSISLTVNPSPTAAFVLPASGCMPHTVNFVNNSTGAVSYQWNFGDNTNSTLANPSHTYNQAGNYTVTLIAVSAGGCTDTLISAGTITVSPQPTASLTASSLQVSENEPMVYFNDLSVNPGTCMLYYGDGDSLAGCGFMNLQHTYPGVGTYCATLVTTSDAGCQDTATVCIEVQPDFTFYIPNSFTPNGDGKNEFFSGFGLNIATYHMMIFDRWGNKIYETFDISKPWDGKANGGSQMAQTDTYVYRIDIVDVTGVTHNYLGKVSLIR